MLINGRKIAEEIEQELKLKISKLPKKPTLAVLIIGEHPASLSYIKMKEKRAKEVGLNSITLKYPENIVETKLLNEISKLNRDPGVDGILVQLPLPSHVHTEKVILQIDPQKDVDGFHPENIGKALLGADTLLPCTPLGIKVLLERSNLEISGKHVVIVGRSNIVGKPLAAILMQKKKGCDATVTVCHSRSENLKTICKSADVLIAAIGSPKFITKEFVKEKAVIVDVGINHIVKDGKKIIVGDVDFENVSPIASAITPVPGGVGPMTIAMLLSNTYDAFLKKIDGN